MVHGATLTRSTLPDAVIATSAARACPESFEGKQSTLAAEVETATAQTTGLVVKDAAVSADDATPLATRMVFQTVPESWLVLR
jgi:hypothetical protein